MKDYLIDLRDSIIRGFNGLHYNDRVGTEVSYTWELEDKTSYARYYGRPPVDIYQRRSIEANIDIPNEGLAFIRIDGFGRTEDNQLRFTENNINLNLAFSDGTTNVWGDNDSYLYLNVSITLRGKIKEGELFDAKHFIEVICPKIAEMARGMYVQDTNIYDDDVTELNADIAKAFGVEEAFVQSTTRGTYVVSKADVEEGVFSYVGPNAYDKLEWARPKDVLTRMGTLYNELVSAASFRGVLCVISPAVNEVYQVRDVEGTKSSMQTHLRQNLSLLSGKQRRGISIELICDEYQEPKLVVSMNGQNDDGSYQMLKADIEEGDMNYIIDMCKAARNIEFQIHQPIQYFTSMFATIQNKKGKDNGQ